MALSRKSILTQTNNANFVRLCIESGVEFLLVGGAAVCHYGGRGDGISEIDLLINCTSENAQKLMGVLDKAGIKPNFTFKNLEAPNVQLPVKTPDYFLDLLTPWKELSYSDLSSRAETCSINNMEVPVVCREDLIKLKEYAVSKLQSEVDKHRKDLACLYDLSEHVP